MKVSGWWAGGFVSFSFEITEEEIEAALKDDPKATRKQVIEDIRYEKESDIRWKIDAIPGVDSVDFSDTVFKDE